MKGSLRIRRYVLLWAVLMAPAGRAWAEDSPAKLVEQGNRALTAGDCAKALMLYEQAAAKRPEAPEIAFNQGVAYYRKGDYDRAAAAFTRALQTRDLELDARARFNLGNTAYAQALAQQADIPAAIEKLNTAISYYRQVIDGRPDDQDARVNIEMAQLLIKDLLDRQKRSREQHKQDSQQKQDEQKQQKQEQDTPQTHSATRPESGEQEPPPQTQPAESPQHGEGEQQEQSPQDQPGQDGQQQPSPADRQDQQDHAGGHGEDRPAEEDQPSGQLDTDRQEASPPEQTENRPVPTTRPVLSRDEAEKLLQLVRDKERQRTLREAQRVRVIEIPVERDW